MQAERFYKAVIEGDEKEISVAFNAIFPVLVTYLRATQNACDDDCRECAQLTLIHTVQKIKCGAIRQPEYLKHYILKALRNQYIRMMTPAKPIIYDEAASYMAEPANQINRLVTVEDQVVLRRCLQKLDHYNREFMEYWMANPGVRAEDVAERFGSTVNAVNQRKFRVLKLLRKCASRYDTG